MPEGVHPDPIHKAVLGLNGGPTDELVVNLACQLAKLHSAELVAIHVIEVNWQHELSDEMTDENLAASSVLDVAEGIAERYKVKLSGDLLQAREVAAALVDEAIELGADAIIVGLPYRKRFGGDFAMGTTRYSLPSPYRSPATGPRRACHGRPTQPSGLPVFRS